MVATVDIMELIGVTGSANTKTSLTVRFKNADDALIDSADPIVIPVAGADWSFEKWLRLQIGATAPSDNVSNARFYFDGANNFGAGVNMWGRSVAAFSTPAELATSTGLTDAFTWTSAAPLSLAGGPFSGTSSLVFSHVVLSMEVSLSATVGALTAETMTFAYDEI